MSILKNNIFWGSSEDKEKAPPPQKVNPSTSHPAIITMSTSPNQGNVTNSADYQQFRQKFAQILADENKRNYPGNDYFEFVVMKNAMNAIPQEDVKYQAAFAGWMTGGNQTKASLLSTGKIYLGLVEKEIADFEEAYKAQYDMQVTKNELLISQKSAKVQELTSQIQALNSEISSLRDANQGASLALSSKHDAFMAAGNDQKQEILDEIDKINQYIK